MGETRKGIVRHDAGGEHPTLGPLVPGTVMDVPVDLWSDSLWSPVAVDSQAAVVVPTAESADLDSGLTAIRAAQASLQSLQDLQAQAQQAPAQIAALQGSLDRFRPLIRSARDLNDAITADLETVRGKIESYSKELAALIIQANDEAQALVAAQTVPAPPAPAPAVSPAVQSTPAAASAAKGSDPVQG